MAPETNWHALGFIVVGALCSFGRDFLGGAYLQLYAWLRRQEPNPKLLPGLRLYLVMTGMIFSIVGLAGLVGILHY